MNNNNFGKNKEGFNLKKKQLRFTLFYMKLLNLIDIITSSSKCFKLKEYNAI